MPVVVRAHVVVKGKVQGVFFRSDTMEKAISLGLAGWVRNLPGGEVEAVFEGERADVEQAVQWCHQGPPHAVVQSVDVGWEEPEGERGFKLRYV